MKFHTTDGAVFAANVNLSQAAKKAEASPNIAHLDDLAIYALLHKKSVTKGESFPRDLAEKMRSLLQQPVRRRNRRQDVYDIWLLRESGPALTADDLVKIHEILVASCGSKGIVPFIHSMESAEVASAPGGFFVFPRRV